MKFLIINVKKKLSFTFFPLFLARYWRC